MPENNFRKLFGNYPVVPNSFNSKSQDIKDTFSHPIIVGAIDDKNYYHQLRVHYTTNVLHWTSFYDSNKLNQNSDCVVFEYIKTPYNNFFEVMNLQEKPYYLNFSNSFTDIENSSYPIGLRYIDSENDLVVFERPPFKMSIDFSPLKAMSTARKRRKYEMQDVSIWIPWTVYVFNMASKSQPSIFIYFNNKPLSSCEDIIFPAVLPNVFNDGRICFGDYQNSLNVLHTDMVKSKKYSLKSIFNEALSYFYSGGWNSDIVPAPPYPEFLRLYSSTRSMKATIKDPRALSIYERATNEAVYYDINKLRSSERYHYRNSAIESYLNALSIWSQYSLEEVMYLFSDHYQSACEHYANGKSYNENYNTQPGMSLESIIRGITMVKYHNHDLKRHKLLGIFNTFANGNNIQNVINSDNSPEDSSVLHEVNFGSGTASRQVYYTNPMTKELNLKTKVFHQEELHEILDHIITEQLPKPKVIKVQQDLVGPYVA